jgi:hypothetical protein
MNPALTKPSPWRGRTPARRRPAPDPADGTIRPAAGKIPGLVNARGEFGNRPVDVGMNPISSSTDLREQLRAEIHAQFEKVSRHRPAARPRQRPLAPAFASHHLRHFDGGCRKLGIRHLRLTRDCLSRSRRMARGRWFYRVSHAAIYEWLSRRARQPLQQRGIKHAQITFGLLQNARVDEEYVLKLLPELPPGDSELYSHPSLDEFKHEFEALVSPRVKERSKNWALN